MGLYLIKSAACLTIFFVFYKIFLEKQNMHQFKRFYLLGMLLASFLIPFITFTEYIEVSRSPISEVVFSDGTTGVVYQQKSLNYSLIIWSLIYGTGVLFFLLKFSKNIARMLQKIRKNTKYKNDSLVHVLLKTPTNPHTFLKYIFFDQKKYEAAEIPKEVLIHEETHAREKHSLDLIFIELLQIVFWFNPIIYFIKYSIKLNHEFLADRSVLNKGIETSNYQNILLAFSSDASSPQLANSINYSSIKKRFKVMKTQTSKRGVLLRTLLLLPLLAGLVYGFSTTHTVEKLSDIDQKAQKIKDETTIDTNTETAPLTNFKDRKKQHNYTTEYLAGAKRNNKKAFVIMVQNNEIMINDGKSTLETFTDDLDQITKDWEETDYTSAYPSILVGSSSNEFLKKLNKAFKKTHYSKANEGISIITSLDAEQAKRALKATPEQISEYNKLAKKYNAMDRNSMRILGKEITRLNYIYGLMTVDQKKNAEPYPNIPPPPPAPEAPNAIKVLKGINDQDKNIPPPPPPPAPKVIKGVNDQGKNIPPPPPVPNPIDHIVEMAKKNATFYFEKKEISSDEAIAIVKGSSNLNLNTSAANSENPQVRISKTSTTIQKQESFVITVIDMPYTGPTLDLHEPVNIINHMIRHGAKIYLDSDVISKEKAIEILKHQKSVKIINVDTPHASPSIIFGEYGC